MKILSPLTIIIFIAAFFAVASDTLQLDNYSFGPFDGTSYSTFAVLKPATISNDALQITPDSANQNFSLKHHSGRALFNTPFKIWDEGGKVISFNSSFLFNIYRPDNTSHPGEGLAFIIAPDLLLPPASHGGYLGLTNATTDGDSTNRIVAIELDTFKQDFDVDDNHIGINVNSVRSVKSASLTTLGIQLSPVSAKVYSLWVDYDGVAKLLAAYIAPQSSPKPASPAISATLDLKKLVAQHSYFGFAASTGDNVQLNCVLHWNLTAEILPEPHSTTSLSIGLGVGLPLGILVIAAALVIGFYWSRKWAEESDPHILGTLKSLPGMPREFEFKELQKATNKFDGSRKLGEGGFGVVYRGLLAKEGLEIAVKKFSRDNIQGKDDFLQELSIINRLRHKHLVKLLGWCHKNGMLLLVYEFMPNGSLDQHLFGGPEKSTLGWNLRYKIISGVASALHYLHGEYDQKVVHRDLKASNIMLGSNFDARLGDFGLARALENEKTSYAELEGIPGTIGYIAPECFHTGKATCESDVYGFGAVVLEVVCGQRPWTKIAGFQLLVDWVWKLHEEDRLVEAVDERLGNAYVVEEAKRLLLLGLACSHPVAISRPKTQAIVQIVSGSIPVPFVPPSKPSFVWPSPAPMDMDYDSADSTPMSSSQYGSEWTSRWVSRDSHASNVGYSDSSVV
uniref:Protein kinase domain-containing protein n=1 Tax=Kalanchoe fedtschenkoi TaxID=63787 RepID=A0A7N0T723_KALFE